MSDLEVLSTLVKNVDLCQNNDTNRVPDNKRVSCNKITKYEKANVIGKLAEIIAQENTTTRKPLDIAYELYEQKKVPFKIKRIFPNGKFEIWSFNELLI